MVDNVSIIYGFGIAVNAFLTLLLFFKKGKIAADKILLTWLCFVLAHQVLNYLEIFAIDKAQFPFLIGVGIPLTLIQAPFLFLYVSQLTDDSYLARNRKYIAVHFLPTAAAYVYMAGFIMSPAAEKIYIMEHHGVGYEGFMTLRFYATYISGVAYVVLSLLKIRAHQQRIRNVFSNTEKVNLQWLKILVYGIGVIWLVVFFGNQIQTFVAVSLYISALGFFGIMQVNIFSNNRKIEEITPEVQNIIEESPEEVQEKYETSKLSDTKKDMIEAGLQQQIDENKLFLNPELTLDVLADTLDVHANDVSQYINGHLGLTFYDYINSKRIEEFKRKVALPESRNLNILGLAFDCGFNSKSTFNRNFKKLTGQTPSEYVNSAKEMSVN
ncbi:MAG: AraC family transcriptional regulator [Bacteroidota bacterium]